MSIMSEYTIETTMTKEEVMKKLEKNVGYHGKGLLSWFSDVNTDLPFYGKVEDEGFKIHLRQSHYALHMFMALEGNVEDNYDSTKIYVKPRGLSPFMIFNLVFANIVALGIMYFAITHFNTPANFIIPAFGAFFVLGNAMMIGQSRYYVHKAKYVFRELFKT